MTEEERQRKREYNREWQRRKRLEDPEYRAKYNEYQRDYWRRRREDPEFAAKERADQLARYHRLKHDPEWLAKRQETKRKNREKLMADPDYRDKVNARWRERYHQKKAKEEQAAALELAAKIAATERNRLKREARTAKPEPRMVVDPLQAALDRICRGPTWKR